MHSHITVIKPGPYPHAAYYCRAIYEGFSWKCRILGGTPWFRSRLSEVVKEGNGTAIIVLPSAGKFSAVHSKEYPSSWKALLRITCKTDEINYTSLWVRFPQISRERNLLVIKQINVCKSKLIFKRTPDVPNGANSDSNSPLNSIEL